MYIALLLLSFSILLLAILRVNRIELVARRFAIGAERSHCLF